MLFYNNKIRTELVSMESEQLNQIYNNLVDKSRIESMSRTREYSQNTVNKTLTNQSIRLTSVAN